MGDSDKPMVCAIAILALQKISSHSEDLASAVADGSGKNGKIDLVELLKVSATEYFAMPQYACIVSMLYPSHSPSQLIEALASSRWETRRCAREPA